MRLRIGLAAGDGIGPEVIQAAARVIQRLDAGIEMTDIDLGWETFLRTGTALPNSSVKTVQCCDAVLLGAVSSPSTRVEGYRSPVVALRQELGLNLIARPTRDPAVGVDFDVLREATEGLYAGRERREPGQAIAERVISESQCAAFLRECRRWIKASGRRRVTLVHKANILPQTCGLFREMALNHFADGSFEVEELLVDAAAYKMATAPESFDCIVTTNLFGDILSDLAAAFGGGIGNAASATIGRGTPVFEPVHGSAPDIAGTGLANPVATFRALEMLLRHLHRRSAADELNTSIDATAAAGITTPDAGGRSTTREVAEAIIQNIQQARLNGEARVSTLTTKEI